MSKIKLRVKDLLKEKGITQKDLAEKLGMTEVGLSIAIGEDGNPPLKRLIEFADALGVDIIELFDATPNHLTFNCPKCGANLAITEI